MRLLNMPKIRKPKTACDNKKIDKFISSADSELKQINIFQIPKLDRNAKRDFNAVKVPFNEYEYTNLEFAAEITGRSKLNFIRYAILKEAENLKNKE